MANQVDLSIMYAADPTIGRPISNGSIYVGIVDLDPKVLGNQKQISVLQENGTTVEVEQPISTSAGGQPIYNDSPVTILVDGSYSLRIDDSTGAQKNYVPKNAELEALSSFDNIADLRAITESPSDGDIFTILGYYIPGDGGGQPLYWDATSTETDNGFIIFKATTITTGRFKSVDTTILNILHAGAYADGTHATETTTAMETCRTALGSVVLPKNGTYLSNATFVTGDYESFHLESNVTLKGAITPVVRVGGLHSSLTGEGWSSIIESTINPTNGIVKLGHELITDSKTVWRNTIKNFQILGNDSFGVSGLSTIGLFVFNSQPWSSNGSVYWNNISNLFVQEVDEAVLATSICNANNYNNIQVWKAGIAGFHIYSPFAADLEGTKYGYDWDAQSVDSPSAENTFTGCSVYDSFQTQVTGACILIDFQGVFNQFTSFAGEPTWGVAYNIGALATSTFIQGQFNAGTGTNTNPESNTILNAGGGSFASLAIRDASIYEQRMMQAGSKAAPSIFDRFSVTTGLYFPTPGTYARSGSIFLDVPGTSGGLQMQGDEDLEPITAAAIVYPTIEAPAGSKIVGVQFIVESALIAGDEWDADFFGGLTTSLVTAGSIAINTKIDLITDSSIPGSPVGIELTRNAGGSFTAQGSIRVIIYYQILVPLDSVP